MIKRDIYKVREYDGELIEQSYGFMVKDKYIKYKKDVLHKFLRSILFDGVPDIFKEVGVPSASSDKTYIAVDYDGNRIYNERKPDDDALPFRVTHYPNCTHIFSQMCLESAGSVDKKFRSELGLTNTNALWQHQKVQNYFMYSGFAEAIEVPVWGNKIRSVLVPGSEIELEYITGFIDIICYWKGRLYILDYKPQCMQAKNKYATSQLLKYRDLLYLRTGIKNIGCAYFDEKDTIVVL